MPESSAPGEAEPGSQLPVSGIILAGGTSSRVGQDKALLSLGGETLLGRTIRVLASCTREVLVIGRPDDGAAATVSRPGLKFLSDPHPQGGPLAGLLGTFTQAQNDWCFVTSCDLPQLNAGLIVGLAQRVSEEVEAIVPVVESRQQPLHALYAKRGLERTRKLLVDPTGRNLAIRALLPLLKVEWVFEPEVKRFDPGLRSFRTVNTAADWHKYQAEHGIEEV